MKLDDTIAAVSTPYGKGGVAMIRISGKDALTVSDRVFMTPGGKRPSGIQVRHAAFGRIFDPHDTAVPVDDVVLTVMKAPHTFTGEDTVEICCHGGVLITQAVLSAVLSAGARAAEAGEFTRRAFVNGRMSLTEAESLGLLLEAQTDTQVKLYRSGMLGKLKERTSEIYERLVRVQSSVFACIDYPDEDLAELGRDGMADEIERCAMKVQSLAATYKTGRAISDGIPTVICGRPNAGKSSLYNMLVGYDAAIVTDIEGTTRDVLTENVSLGRVLLRLKDTAGIREGADAVESIGIRRALDEISSAELILAVFDCSEPLTDEDLSLIGTLSGTDAIRLAILNKVDTEGAKERADAFEREFSTGFEGSICTSALEGVGLDALRDKVEALYLDGSLSIGSDAVVLNARQATSLTEAHASLIRALDLLREGAELDMCCADVEEALISLGSVDGRAVSEDVVASIFSHFCVGK